MGVKPETEVPVEAKDLAAGQAKIPVNLPGAVERMLRPKGRENNDEWGEVGL